MRKAGLSGARVLGYALVMVGPLGCSDPLVGVPGAESSTGEPSSGSTTGGGSSSTSATTGLADGTTGPASTGEPEMLFVPETDVGAYDECNLLTQNCPPGYKCMSWANDGGAWNAFRCTPIAENPVPVDEPCHVEGSATSGIDDCELGAICYDVDPETLEGTCVPMCVGNEREIYCEDPARFCYISNDGAIIPCLRGCDPVEQDCLAGEACYSIGNYWFCAPDASGDELGAYGDPCAFINVCDPGLICLDTSAVPPGLPCEGAPGCCSEVCDITDPAGDQQCAGAAEGQTCQAWYQEGEAPVLWDHVGACALPSR